MKFSYLVIVLFLGYVAWKFYENRPAISGRPASKAIPSRVQDRPGVSAFCTSAAPQSGQQLQAFSTRNRMQTTQPGFAPAFGFQENIPWQVKKANV